MCWSMSKSILCIHLPSFLLHIHHSTDDYISHLSIISENGYIKNNRNMIIINWLMTGGS